MINNQRFHCEKSDTLIIASKSSTPGFSDYFFLTISTGSASYELTITQNDARNLADMLREVAGDGDEPNPNQQALDLPQLEAA